MQHQQQKSAWKREVFDSSTYHLSTVEEFSGDRFQQRCLSFCGFNWLYHKLICWRFWQHQFQSFLSRNSLAHSLTVLRKTFFALSSLFIFVLLGSRWYSKWACRFHSIRWCSMIYTNQSLLVCVFFPKDSRAFMCILLHILDQQRCPGCWGGLHQGWEFLNSISEHALPRYPTTLFESFMYELFERYILRNTTEFSLLQPGLW